jgi:uncharacterized membrane protein
LQTALLAQEAGGAVVRSAQLLVERGIERRAWHVHWVRIDNGDRDLFRLRRVTGLCSNSVDVCCDGGFLPVILVLRTALVRITLLSMAFALLHLCAQKGALAAQAPEQKPAAKTPTIATEAAPPSPVSKHYPILVIAHGNEPAWSLRLGMKGPERLDRANYPPVVLDPGETSADDPGKAWTYHAKDEATGADVTVKLFREACTDAAADFKYTFRVAVEHGQIGTLNGCGQSTPEKFPEFRKKNQLEPDDNADDKDKDKDKDKKTVLDPITNFKMPVAVAYLSSAGKVMFKRGTVVRQVAADGSQLEVSHDGTRLLYTREEKTSGRVIVLYDSATGKSMELLRGNVQEAFWSPDDSHFAFLKFVDGLWHLWTAPVTSPETATAFSLGEISSIDGWIDAHTILVDDLQKFSWVSDDAPVQRALSEKEIFGDAFGFSSTNTVRVHPLNPDLLLVSAEWIKVPPGTPTDKEMGKDQAFFLYEITSKRRVILSPLDMFAQDAVWSPDGLQIFFTGTDASRSTVIYRMFWDGSGLQKYATGSGLAIGK